MTKSTNLSRFVEKYVDFVIKTFVLEKSAKFVTPGHEEIELALVKLYDTEADYFDANGNYILPINNIGINSVVASLQSMVDEMIAAVRKAWDERH